MQDTKDRIGGNDCSRAREHPGQEFADATSRRRGRAAWPERAAMAAEDLEAWQSVLAEVDALLGGLEPGERQVAENAIKAVRAMRNRMRNSSLPLGDTLEGRGP